MGSNAMRIYGISQSSGVERRLHIEKGAEGIVLGSHGLPAAEPLDRPILIGHGANPGSSVPMTAVRNLLLEALDLG